MRLRHDRDGGDDGEGGEGGGDLEGEARSPDQTRSLSCPQPVPLLQSSSSSPEVHRRPPAAAQSASAFSSVMSPGQSPIPPPSDPAQTEQSLFLRHGGSFSKSEQQRTGCSSAGSAHRGLSEHLPCRPHSTHACWLSPEHCVQPPHVFQLQSTSQPCVLRAHVSLQMGGGDAAGGGGGDGGLGLAELAAHNSQAPQMFQLQMASRRCVVLPHHGLHLSSGGGGGLGAEVTLRATKAMAVTWAVLAERGGAITRYLSVRGATRFVHSLKRMSDRPLNEWTVAPFSIRHRTVMST